MNQPISQELAELVFLSLENEITAPQQERLEAILQSDPSALGHYRRLINVAIGVKDPNHLKVLHGTDCPLSYDFQMWDALSEEEKTAPAVEKLESPEELIQKVVYQKNPIRISKWSLTLAIMSAAAVLLMVTLIQLAPDRSGKEVATLKGNIKAKWIENGVPTVSGTRLMNTDPPLILGEGVAEIQFDSGARVVVEAPSEFQIETQDQISLRYGRVFVDISGAPINFSVQTPQSKIIDLGTQFGVSADMRGQTELHVVEGKTILIAGSSKDGTGLKHVTQGQALSVDMQGKTQKIPYKPHQLARAINPQSGVVWRGQNISLADIVGGGNGLGTGRQDYGIIIATGKPSKEALFITGHGHLKEKNWGPFCPVPEIPGVDGIFVPDSGSGPVVISSRGHVFKDCPDTNGFWSGQITNGAKSQSMDFSLVLDNVSYGNPDNPALFLHANAGVTYDINAIRAALPAGRSITRFISSVVTPREVMNNPTHVDIWVLVDGHVRFSKINAAQSQSFAVDIPIAEQDSFLTLAVTDGIGDIQTASVIKNSFDWCFFCRPELVLNAN